MPFVVLGIIAVVVICIMVGKSKSNSASYTVPGERSKSTEAFVNNNPYYSGYKTMFDYIRLNGEQSSYKSDWLMESLRMGRTLEGNGCYVISSIDEHLPYFCETEGEYDAVRKSPALRGDAMEILVLAFRYANNKECSHPSKMKFWADQLIERAEQGDYVAQAALCGNLAKGTFSSDKAESFRSKYEAGIRSAANAGNPYAQLGLGQFLTAYPSAERIEWLTKAAEGNNLSDAWFHLMQAYDALRFKTIDGEQRHQDLSEEEQEEINRKLMECYLKGAEADNGARAGECQRFVAGCYEDGDFILPFDLEKAKYWYEKAAKNGMNTSSDLERVIRKML